MTAPLTPERLDEIEASIPAIVRGPWRLERDNALGEWVIWTGADDPILQVLIWGSDLGPFIESVPTVIPELLAEIRRLRGEVEHLADLDDAATRRSGLQAERDRAVTRWHEEHKWAARLRSQRDRLHDALGHVLVGPWESNGAGDVRSPWIPAAEAQGWRRLLAGTPRSECDGETAQEGPGAPTAPSEPARDAPGPGSAQRGAVDRDGAAR